MGTKAQSMKVFSHIQSDVLTSVTSVIGYIYSVIEAAILIAVYEMCIALKKQRSAY